MPERWERDLRRLNEVPAPTERIRARPAEGWTRSEGTALPPARQRVAAGFVAFAVFLGAGFLAWRALGPGGNEGSGAEPSPVVVGSASGTPAPTNAGVVFVPAVIGLSFDEARTRIEAAGLTVGDVRVVPGAYVTEAVVKQDPVVGMSVDASTTIDLVIGPSPCIEGYLDPDCADHTWLVSVLEDAGFKMAGDTGSALLAQSGSLVVTAFIGETPLPVSAEPSEVIAGTIVTMYDEDTVYWNTRSGRQVVIRVQTRHGKLDHPTLTKLVESSQMT